MSSNSVVRFATLGLLGLTLTVAPVAIAQEKTAPPKPTEQKKTTVAAPAQKSQQPGMVVVKDPVTGQLRAPTAEEFKALQESAASVPAATAATEPRTFNGPGGSVGVVLDDSTTVFAVATKTADGKVAIGEVTGAAAAKAAGSQTTPKPAAPAKGAKLDEK